MPRAALPASPAAGGDGHHREHGDRVAFARQVVDGAHDARGAVPGQAEDQRVLAGVVAGGRCDVEREAAGEAGQRAGQRAGADGDRGDGEQHQVRVGGGQRQPVHHGELDDDGGEQDDGEREAGQRAPRRWSARAPWPSPGHHHPDHAEAGEVDERRDDARSGVSEPGWVVTADTMPTGTPGTYGRPPTEPKVTSSWPGRSVAFAENRVSRSAALPVIESGGAAERADLAAARHPDADRGAGVACELDGRGARGHRGHRADQAVAVEHGLVDRDAVRAADVDRHRVRVVAARRDHGAGDDLVLAARSGAAAAASCPALASLGLRLGELGAQLVVLLLQVRDLAAAPSRRGRRR